jgi:hypothetical protein
LAAGFRYAEGDRFSYGRRVDASFTIALAGDKARDWPYHGAAAKLGEAGDHSWRSFGAL